MKRTVTALENGRWSFSGSVPGFTVTATPSTLDLKAGQKAEVTLTFTRTDAPVNTWQHGFFSWSTAKGKAVPSVTSPVTLKALSAAVTSAVTGRDAAGSASLEINPGVTGQLAPTVLGLNKAESTKVTATPVSGSNMKVSRVTVAEGTKALTVKIDAGATTADWDLLVQTPPGKQVSSATEASDESITITNPVPGTYLVASQLDATADGGADTATLETTQLCSDMGNLTVTPNPVPVTTGQKTQAAAAWSGLTSGTWRGQVQ